MNGHRFTTIVSNQDLPISIHTQSHQILFQDCWFVSVIHKLPDSTQTTFAANLKQNTNSSSHHSHPWTQHLLTPPLFQPRPSGTYDFLSVFSILLLKKATVSAESFSCFITINSLRSLQHKSAV